jgi:hypothetical protein
VSECGVSKWLNEQVSEVSKCVSIALTVHTVREVASGILEFSLCCTFLIRAFMNRYASSLHMCVYAHIYACRRSMRWICKR